MTCDLMEACFAIRDQGHSIEESLGNLGMDVLKNKLSTAVTQ